MPNIAKTYSKTVPELLGRLPKRGRGRPKGSGEYAPADYLSRIVERLLEGESLAMICDDADMPSLRTVVRWMAEDSQFRAEIDLAKQEGLEALASYARLIARGIPPHSTGDVLRDRLLISLVFWLIAKREARSLRAHGNVIIRVNNETLSWGFDDK